ncbi:MAG: HAMP domain-containing protein [Cyanobacteria bacterium SBLK]|nr:HAMP domain-containing protein [Cyanobacteria bacterium SBLK]
MKKIKIGAKIFGLALGMLGLSLIAVSISYHRLRLVRKEVYLLSEYTISLANSVTEINIHVLQQHFFLHRIFRFYELEPRDRRRIDSEISNFERRGDLVDTELGRANSLIQQALSDRQLPTSRKQISSLISVLEKIEEEHRDFHDRAREIMGLLAEDSKIQARQLENSLEDEEEKFNREIANILKEINQFTIESARSGQQHQQQVLQLGVFVAGIAAISGLLSASAIATGLVRPTRDLTRKIKTIGENNFNIEISVPSQDEIGEIARSFNKMIAELKQKEKIKEMFGKYVDPRAIAHLLEDPKGTQIVGEKRTMTVFFSDIEGWYTLENSLVSRESIAIINQYLTLMSAPISHHRGVIDKFLGTTIMAFWGEPFTTAKDRDRLACHAALEQIASLDSLRLDLAPKIARENLEQLDLRIGLATGESVVGNMGSESSKSYTVIGDAVNLASRLQGASKQYGVRILIAESTRNNTLDVIETREIDRIQVVGKEESARVYEVLALKGNLPSHLATLRDCFERGLSAYGQRNWQKAETLFGECLQLQPDDRPSQIFRDRVLQFQQAPPSEDWDGTWQLAKK